MAALSGKGHQATGYSGPRSRTLMRGSSTAAEARMVNVRLGVAIYKMTRMIRSLDTSYTHHPASWSRHSASRRTYVHEVEAMATLSQEEQAEAREGRHGGLAHSSL